MASALATSAAGGNLGRRRAVNLQLHLPLPPQGGSSSSSSGPAVPAPQAVCALQQAPAPQAVGAFALEHDSSSRERSLVQRRSWAQDEGLERFTSWESSRPEHHGQGDAGPGPASPEGGFLAPGSRGGTSDACVGRIIGAESREDRRPAQDGIHAMPRVVSSESREERRPVDGVNSAMHVRIVRSESREERRPVDGGSNAMPARIVGSESRERPAEQVGTASEGSIPGRGTAPGHFSAVPVDRQSSRSASDAQGGSRFIYGSPSTIHDASGVEGDSILAPDGSLPKLSLRGPRSWGRDWQWPELPTELPLWDTPRSGGGDGPASGALGVGPSAGNDVNTARTTASADAAAGGAISNAVVTHASVPGPPATTTIGKTVGDLEAAWDEVASPVKVSNTDPWEEPVEQRPRQRAPPPPPIDTGQTEEEPVEHEPMQLSPPPPIDTGHIEAIGHALDIAGNEADEERWGWESDAEDEVPILATEVSSRDVDAGVFPAHMAEQAAAQDAEPAGPQPACELQALEDAGHQEPHPLASVEGSSAASNPAPRRRRCKCRCWCCCACCTPTLKDFPCCMIHCPLLFAGIVSLMVPALIGAFWPGFEVVSDFDSFLEADSRANEVRAAFISALNYRKEGRRLTAVDAGPEGLVGASDVVRRYRRSSRALSAAGASHAADMGDVDETNPRIDPQVLHKIVGLRLMYRAKDGGSVVTPACLGEIASFELGLRNLPAWQRMCREINNEALTAACDPGISLVNHIWPEDLSSEEAAQKPRHQLDTLRYALNGMGKEPLPIGAGMVLVQTAGLRSMLFTNDYSGGTDPDFLRTVFEFNLKCCHMMDSNAAKASQLAAVTQEYNDFVTQDLYPAIREFVEMKSQYIDVFYEGDMLEGHEVWATLMADSMMALGSVSFILCYLTLHTKSPLLSLGALLLTIMAIPTAFVTSAVLSGNHKVTGASFLSLFLIVGLGADVVLVFISFWELSKDLFEKADHPSRISYMYKNAGLSCLATSMTTAASFFANLASVLRPLREFGFFMGLCITGAYLLILVGFPAILIIDEKLMDCIRRCCCCAEQSPEFKASGSVDSFESEDDCSIGTPGEYAKGESDVTTRVSDQATQGRYKQCLELYIVRILVPHKWTVFLVSTAVPILATYWTAMEAKVDSNMPEMFPPGHNRNDGKKVSSRFSPTESMWPQVHVRFCTVGPEAKTGPCMLNWCQIGGGDARGRRSTDGSAICECKFSPSVGCAQERSGEVMFTSRFVGLEYVPDNYWTSKEWFDHAREAVRQANGGSVAFRNGGVAMTFDRWRNLSALVQENWETGLASLSPFLLGPTLKFDVSPRHGLCPASEVCYCGVPTCRLTGESLAQSSSPAWSVLEIPAGDRPYANGYSGRRAEALAPVPVSPQPLLRRGGMLGGRRLQNPNWIDISFVWGLKVKTGTPMLGDPEPDTWSFDPDFRADTPSAQRHMMKTCELAKENEALRVAQTSCWIKEFRQWLRSRGELFPVRSTRFADLMQRFAAGGLLPTGTTVQDQLWFDEMGALTAAFVRLDVDMPYDTTPAPMIMEFQVLWDKFTEDLNRDAPPDASGAWHTSRLWIRAEAEQAIVGSTMMTMAVSAGCGFLGALSFTHGDLALAMMVVLCVLGVTAMLAFFMTVIMGWGYGAVEVLGLIVFVGYSITYSLHIVHKYREHTRLELAEHIEGGNRARRERAVVHALRVMTSAVLGSAVTTLGSSIFLVFCTMRIFVKLAGVLFAVTFFAAVFAVVALPSALLCVGPIGLCGMGPVSERRKNAQGDKADHEQLLGHDGRGHHHHHMHCPASPRHGDDPHGRFRTTSMGSAGSESVPLSPRGRANSRASKSEVYISAMEATTTHHLSRHGVAMPGGAPGIRPRPLVVAGVVPGCSSHSTGTLLRPHPMSDGNGAVRPLTSPRKATGAAPPVVGSSGGGPQPPPSSAVFPMPKAKGMKTSI